LRDALLDATREIVRNSPEIPVVLTTLVSLKGWYGGQLQFLEF